MRSAAGPGLAFPSSPRTAGSHTRRRPRGGPAFTGENPDWIGIRKPGRAFRRRNPDPRAPAPCPRFQPSSRCAARVRFRGGGGGRLDTAAGPGSRYTEAGGRCLGMTHPVRFTAAVTREGRWYVARCLEVEVASQAHRWSRPSITCGRPWSYIWRTRRLSGCPIRPSCRRSPWISRAHESSLAGPPGAPGVVMALTHPGFVAVRQCESHYKLPHSCSRHSCSETNSLPTKVPMSEP